MRNTFRKGLVLRRKQSEYLPPRCHGSHRHTICNPPQEWEAGLLQAKFCLAVMDECAQKHQARVLESGRDASFFRGPVIAVSNFLSVCLNQSLSGERVGPLPIWSQPKLERLCRGDCFDTL